MHRYVGVLLTLTVVQNLGVYAAGNIGCLFSDTLCEQEREWCFDDHAFGHCLPHYGHYREEDLHRYDLGPDELRKLEQEMQKLFLLGYRWSHTYTQCVLQELLQAIRRKVDFDISSCNGDADQDLEGALRAIEGEELVDPRDLAIVRFTPSATDPHSDFADEVYFPPIKEQLLGEQSSGDHHDAEDQRDAGDHQESPTSEPGESSVKANGVGNNDQDSNPTPQHQFGGGIDNLPVNPPGPPMNEPAPVSSHDYYRPPNHHDPRHQNYVLYGPDDIEDFDDDDNSASYQSPYHYQTPMNPVYRKRSRPVGQGLGNIFAGLDRFRSRPSSEGDLANILQDNKFNIRNIANLLDNIEGPLPFMPEEAQGRSFFPGNLRKEGLNDQENGMNEGFFGESPSRPMYSEAGIQFIPEVEDELQDELMENAAREAILSNMPEDVRAMPDGIRGVPEEFRNYPRFLDSLSSGNDGDYGSPYLNFPENMRSNPGGLDDLPEEGYGQMALGPQEYQAPESLAADNSIPRSIFLPEAAQFGIEKDISPYGELMLNEEEDAFEKLFGPQLNSVRDYEDDYAYPNYEEDGDDEPLDENGDYGQYNSGVSAPGQWLPDPAFPFLQKFDKKDEERADGDYDDIVPAGRNFQRPERLDVKKPGPLYPYANGHAFDREDDLNQDSQMFSRDSPLLRKIIEPRYEDPGQEPRYEDTYLEPRYQDSDQGSSYRDDDGELMMRDVADVDVEQLADQVLDEEGLVDDVGPQAQKYQAKNSEEPGEGTETPSEEPPISEETLTEADIDGPQTYVYITIDGTFKTKLEGSNMATAIARLAGISERDVEHLSVDEDQLKFRVKENSKGITAADVARNAMDVNDQLKAQTGHTISQAVAGTKQTAMSAMVFSSSEKHILAASALVCGVMAALLVAASVLFFLRRHAKSKEKLLGLTSQDTEASKDYEYLCRARMAGKAGDGGKGETPSTHAPSQRIHSLSKDSDNGNNSPSSRSSTSSCEEPVASNMDISTGHMVLSYMEDHLKNKDRLEQEWIALCAYEAEPCATTIALKPDNNKKNRYPDAVPYDHNRVILNSHANVNGSDYINASSIQTDHDPRNPAYIATQGPLQSTAADFWQLVWEQGSVVIVMLTRLTENGLSFCHRYWPEEGSDLYHIYEVHLVSEHIWCDDYLVRSFYLKNVKTGETRTVTQFHFLSWPDSGTPASTKALLEFRRKVNKSYRGRSCPIIVHCSNGIGRTGTYCLIDMVLNRMAKGAKEIDIAATLEHIRDQRPHMVKSKGQFEFVLMAVAEEVHAILKALPQ